MENFYDLNDFIVFTVKKWKTYLIIILVCIIGFAGTRGYSLLKQYANQDAQQVSDNQTSGQEEPMWAKVSQVIKIEPEFEMQNGQNVDVSNQIIQAYAGICNSETVMQSMYDNWYEKEKQEDVNRKKLFQSYGYILDKEVNYPYAKYDFYSQFLLNGNSVNGLNAASFGNADYNYISVGFKSTNTELAKQIAKDYAERLTAEVEKKIGKFDYEYVNDTITYELPARSEGTQAGRTAQTTAVFSITTAYIVKQVIKGMIWGGILGVFVGIILIFFSYMMTKKIYLSSDIKKLNLNVLGLSFLQKTKLKKLKAKWFALTEGEKWDVSGGERLILYIREKTINEVGKIAVSGTIREEYVKHFVKRLNDETDKYIYIENVTDSPDGIKKISEDIESVILIEQFGKSLKEEVEKEVKVFTEKEINIMGMIGIE